MNATNYISEYQANVAIKYQNDHQIKSEKNEIWWHKHPSIAKIIQIACIILGLAAIATVPFSYPVLGSLAVVIGIAGGFVATISALSLLSLGLVLPPKHDMKSHVFKPATFEAGKLYYQGDVPILELQSDDPYKAGKAHGFLMAPYLNILYAGMWAMYYSARAAGREAFKASEVPHVLQAIRDTIPPDYLKELEGIVDGYNKWEESKISKKKLITVDELLLFHLIHDELHFKPLEHEARLRNDTPYVSPKAPYILNLGCTVVVDKDEKEGMIFGHNKGLPSMGIFGTYSLIINRKYKDQRLSTAEIGLPGLVGTMTGMNEKGLSLAMNFSPGKTKANRDPDPWTDSHFDKTEEINGMPAVFYNRMCLENCVTVDEVLEEIQKQAPLGPYHLSAVDVDNATAFHFFQTPNGPHTIRPWQQENVPLIVTNANYEDKPDGIRIEYNGGDLHRSFIIKNLFIEAKKYLDQNELNRAQLVEASLTLPFVDNKITIHRVVMNPLSKKIKVAFDNAFAGSNPLHELNTEEFFRRS